MPRPLFLAPVQPRVHLSSSAYFLPLIWDAHHAPAHRPCTCRIFLESHVKSQLVSDGSGGGEAAQVLQWESEVSLLEGLTPLLRLHLRVMYSPYGCVRAGAGWHGHTGVSCVPRPGMTTGEEMVQSKHRHPDFQHLPKRMAYSQVGI